MNLVIPERPKPPVLGNAARWRTTRFILAVFLSILAGWLAIRGIGFGVVLETLRDSNLLLLALALGLVLATTLFKSHRWRVLLRPHHAPIDGFRVLRVLLVGQMANSFLPARLGDALRAALIGPGTAGGTAAALGTIVAEKALDGAMGLATLIALAIWTPLPPWLRYPALALATVTACFLMLVSATAAPSRWIDSGFGWLSKWIGPSAHETVRRSLASFFLGLQQVRKPEVAFRALLWSAVIWGLAALTNTVTLAALGIQAPSWSTWLVLVTGYVINFVPTVPAQIGIFEYACLLALKAAGLQPEPALAFGLVLHALVYAPPAVLGPISMALEGVKWASLKPPRSDCAEGHIAAQ
jgi:uncharacterized protein (TIRG00374 family)